MIISVSAHSLITVSSHFFTMFMISSSGETPNDTGHRCGLVIQWYIRSPWPWLLWLRNTHRTLPVSKQRVKE